MGTTPVPGWNLSKSYGPIYLLKECHSKELQKSRELENDGHFFETKEKLPLKSKVFKTVGFWAQGMLASFSFLGVESRSEC